MVISEFLPNPVGKDTDAEWIKLFNNEEKEVNLSGWQLKDTSGKTYIFGNKKIDAGQYLILDYKTTKISLNNNGETLFLFDRSGNLIDKAEYVGAAAEGKIFNNLSLKTEEKSVSENPVRQNIAIIYDSGRLPDLNFILIGLGIALLLALASILIIKKLDLNNE